MRGNSSISLKNFFIFNFLHWFYCQSVWSTALLFRHTAHQHYFDQIRKTFPSLLMLVPESQAATSTCLHCSEVGWECCCISKCQATFSPDERSSFSRKHFLKLNHSRFSWYPVFNGWWYWPVPWFCLRFNDRKYLRWTNMQTFLQCYRKGTLKWSIIVVFYDW